MFAFAFALCHSVSSCRCRCRVCACARRTLCAAAAAAAAVFAPLEGLFTAHSAHTTPQSSPDRRAHLRLVVLVCSRVRVSSNLCTCLLLTSGGASYSYSIQSVVSFSSPFAVLSFPFLSVALHVSSVAHSADSCPHWGLLLVYLSNCQLSSDMSASAVRLLRVWNSLTGVEFSFDCICVFGADYLHYQC